MEPVRVGVVGCGVIGPHHMESATKSPLLKLVAVADLIEDRAQAAAQRFGAKKVYREGADLAADPEVEVVVLAFPAGRRTELALRAFSQGKHVLVEKPVAMNADEVRQMMAARGRLAAACCSSRFRLWKSAQVATDFVAGGGLGDLRLVRIRELRPAGLPPAKTPPDWRLIRARNGGGILMNWGCYDLDYVLGITGWTLQPQTVFAQTWTVPPVFQSHVFPGSDAETHYTALVRCAGGVTLTIERGEYMTCAADAAWQVIGTKGSLKLHMTHAKPKIIVHDEATTEKGVTSRTLWEGEEETGFVAESPLTDLALTIREGRPPMTSLERALVVQQISDGVYASARRGTAVRIR